MLRHGDNLTITAGTAHVVSATGDGEGRALVGTSPSGFARLIAEVGTADGGDGATPSAPLDMERFLRVPADLGGEILGPPGALPEWRGRPGPATGRPVRAAGMASCTIGGEARAILLLEVTEVDLRATGPYPIRRAT